MMNMSGTLLLSEWTSLFLTSDPVFQHKHQGTLICRDVRGRISRVCFFLVTPQTRTAERRAEVQPAARPVCNITSRQIDCV